MAPDRLRRVGGAALAALTLALAWTGAGASAPGDGNGDAPWVVATYAYPQRDRAAAVQPLADYLARRSGHAVQVRILPSPTALVEALRGGEVDVAVPNLHGYLQARAGEGAIVALPVPDVPPVQADRYRAVLVARDGIATLAELPERARDLRLALVGADSASGGFVPMAALRDLGLDPRTGFAALDYAGSHAAALQAVAEGRADVAALAADVYDAAPAEGVHELWRSGPIPPGPLLCRASATMDCRQVAAWLLQAHTRDPAVMAALRAGWPEFGDATAFTVAPPLQDVTID